LTQVEAAKPAVAAAGVVGTGPAPPTYSSEAAVDEPADDEEAAVPTPSGGTLASDEALAALREKLTGDK
jgi:hypothetical protein